jgi:hypothetical protein
MANFTFVPLSQTLEDPSQASSALVVAVPSRQVSVQPAQLYFGSVALGAQSGVQQLTLTNTGTKRVSVNQIVGVGPFLVSHNCPDELEPGASCAISAVFAPTGLGGATGGVYVDAGDAATKGAFIQLNGAGLSSASPAAGLSVTQLNFGEVVDGQTSPIQVATVTNLGVNPLTVTAIQSTGAPFNVTFPALPITLNNGQSMNVNMTFSPVALGVANGSVTLVDNGAGQTTITMTGTGVAA